MKNKTKILLVISFIILVILGIGLFMHFLIIAYTAEGRVDKESAESFALHEFPSLLDLAKAFLTLLIGTFVGSITFSDKIVNPISSNPLSKIFLFISWSLTLLSIVLVGIGICFFYNSYWLSLYSHTINYTIYNTGAISYGLSGISFCIALSSMLYAGITSFLSASKVATESPGKYEKKDDEPEIPEKKEEDRCELEKANEVDNFPIVENSVTENIGSLIVPDINSQSVSDL